MAPSTSPHVHASIAPTRGMVSYATLATLITISASMVLYLTSLDAPAWVAIRDGVATIAHPACSTPPTASMVAG